MIIWIENATENHAIDVIRRLTKGDLSLHFFVGEPSDVDTKLSIDELKKRRIVGIYQNTSYL